MNQVTQFVLNTLERAAKTAAQVALLAFGTEKLNILHVDWTTVGGLAGGGFVLSILTSIASQPFGDKSSPSVLPVSASPVTQSDVSDL